MIETVLIVVILGICGAVELIVKTLICVIVALTCLGVLLTPIAVLIYVGRFMFTIGTADDTDNNKENQNG